MLDALKIAFMGREKRISKAVQHIGFMKITWEAQIPLYICAHRFPLYLYRSSILKIVKQNISRGIM